MADHCHNLSCISVFHKQYFSRDLPLPHSVPEPYVLAQSTRYAEQRHKYSVAEPRCNTAQIKNNFYHILLGFEIIFRRPFLVVALKADIMLLHLSSSKF